ncbi:MAG: type II toxin-antitoxin system death-on-curing family toxin [Bacilli bacterium]|nr:type II toxin-antitoxin system death-on-curing family toxin [Bacilli bacterium]
MKKEVNEITFDDVLLINSLCLFEGEPRQLVNKGAVESALGNQFQPYSRKEEAFASVYKSLVINHGFMNGNKRTGVISLYLASKMLGNELALSDEELFNLTMKLASEGGSKIKVEDIANKVFKNSSSKENVDTIKDISSLVKQYIKEHERLMKELAK